MNPGISHAAAFRLSRATRPLYKSPMHLASLAIGYSGKGWGPGTNAAGGRTRDPSDPRVDPATDVFDSYPYHGPKLISP